jgi:DNA (cytosine-5)-methyltransferase 1
MMTPEVSFVKWTGFGRGPSGSGASEGIRRATGRCPAVAVNHNPAAIAMHAANHPTTRHFCESVFAVDPHDAVLGIGESVDLMHSSPDCTHHSRAKGGKPRDAGIRGLAWIVPTWAKALHPRVITLENVPEFLSWGPLDELGKPIKSRAGETFRQWAAALEALGYRIDWRVLNAADFGAPTSRKRLFVIGRRDGRPVRWPEPSHGPDRPQPWRTAAECIDWSIPCPSIFTRKKPLAEATQRRIAEGIRRYVLTNSRPFLVNLTHGGRVHPTDEPMRTVTAAHRGEKALVTPFMTPVVG